jgi:hypothetical protein
VLPLEGRDPRCRPHPLGSFLQALRLEKNAPRIPRVFVYATGWSETPFTPQFERLRNDPAWRVHSLACGHDVVHAAPEDVFAILTATAQEAAAARRVTMVK